MNERLDLEMRRAFDELDVPPMPVTLRAAPPQRRIPAMRAAMIVLALAGLGTAATAATTPAGEQIAYLITHRFWLPKYLPIDASGYTPRKLPADVTLRRQEAIAGDATRTVRLTYTSARRPGLLTIYATRTVDRRDRIVIDEAEPRATRMTSFREGAWYITVFDHGLLDDAEMAHAFGHAPKRIEHLTIESSLLKPSSAQEGRRLSPPPSAAP